MAIVIGMNSGSSFDGIDVVAVELDMAADGHPAPPRFVEGIGYDWPPEVQALVLRAFDNDLSVFELTRLGYVAGAVYAAAASSLMQLRGLRAEDVEVIGVDGQTIYQEPPDRARFAAVAEGDIVGRWLQGPYACGLQIGEPAVIATHCDVPVVSNFRPSDHALGGTGAPLMQYLDFVAFRGVGPVLTLNIGGIANCQLAGPDRSRMMAFDTGPGNVMVDHAMRTLFDRPYDDGGKVGASGRVDVAMLAELHEHPFFARLPPRCAWRLDFGAAYADQVLARHAHLPAEDVVATLTAFTASSIVASLRHVIGLEDVTVLIASGGGVRNRTLLRMLEERLPAGLRLSLSDEYGIPAQYKEAVKFATLAYATRRQLANNIPAASGASSFAVLGKTVLPPRAAREALIPPSPASKM